MMSSFVGFTVCRSDGVPSYQYEGATILNEPPINERTEDPKAQDGYKKVEEDSDKTVEWKAKLGAITASAFGWDARKQYILKEFPEGYTLWQNFQTVEKKATKRQDAFLYGYPPNPKNPKNPRKFKSPADFSHHLLWLAIDEEGNRDNCGCKFCSPESREKKEDTEVAAKEGGNEEYQQDQIDKGHIIRSPEQKFDSDPNNPFLYRPGELVWFNKGSAWGLAVICRRQATNPNPRYMLQPLCHPLKHLPSQIKEQHDIRPFLAWSVPSPTHSQIGNMTYDQVPWELVLRGEFGGGDVEVDGSILAAKRIDGSYTFFDRVDVPTAGRHEVFYNAMFLGAEKIWAGEAIRLHTSGDDVLVMVIDQMKETMIDAKSQVTITGDVYRLVQINDWQKAGNVHQHQGLPPRMLMDLSFRNEAAKRARRDLQYEWRLSESLAKKSLQDIKGRWYETRTLLPVLKGLDQFNQEVSQGIITDAGLWMNSRGAGNLEGQRKKNRLDTLGTAVPPDVKISRGLSGPPEDNVFPDDAPNPSAYRGATDGDVSQYVNNGQTNLQQPFYLGQSHGQ